MPDDDIATYLADTAAFVANGWHELGAAQLDPYPVDDDGLPLGRRDLAEVLWDVLELDNVTAAAAVYIATGRPPLGMDLHLTSTPGPGGFHLWACMRDREDDDDDDGSA